MLPAIPSGAGGVQHCTSEGFTHFSSRFCRGRVCPWKVSPGDPPSPRNAPLCSLTLIRPSGCGVRFPRLSLWVVVLAKTSVTTRLSLIYFTKITIAAFQMTLPSFFTSSVPHLCVPSSFSEQPISPEPWGQPIGREFPAHLFRLWSGQRHYPALHLP